MEEHLSRENKMGIEIRRAGPEHASFLAWVMITSARSHVERGIWDIALDNDEAECLRFLETSALTGTPHMLHFSNFIIAEIDGRPGAALCGYDPEVAGEESLMRNMGEIVKRLGWSGEFYAEAEKRIEPCLACHFEEEPDFWVVNHVATRPEFRRRGLVKSLLARILDVGREQGFAKARVAVLMGNTPAIGAYEKAGFEVKSEITRPDFEAVMGEPGSLLMLCDL
jgi:translation initiation factor 4G